MSTVEALIAEQLVPAGVWRLDPAHSTFEFAVRHMGIATVKGRFTDVAATLTGAEPRLEGTVGIASVDTKDESRDEHLRSPEFFDAERFLQATFISTRIEPGRVVGELTLRGVTRELELTGYVTEPSTDPWGNERIGLDLEGEINRHDFGVSWNAPLPTGGLLLGDTVKLAASLSFVREA